MVSDWIPDAKMQKRCQNYKKSTNYQLIFMDNSLRHCN